MCFDKLGKFLLAGLALLIATFSLFVVAVVLSIKVDIFFIYFAIPFVLYIAAIIYLVLFEI